MIILKSFLREIDARVAAAHLESQGIETMIKKDDCGGNYPQLQMSSGVQLFINAVDEEVARRILDEVESDSTSIMAPDVSKSKKGTTILVIGFLLLGVWLGYILYPKIRTFQAAAGVSKDIIKEDTNGDNRTDIYYYYTNEKLTHVEADRNYDGRIDARHDYIGGRIVAGEYDDNFDGKLDAWAKYQNDNNYNLEVDTDFNGVSDVTNYYVNQLPAQIDWHPNGATIITKREIYKDGIKQREYIDLDKDGNFDISVEFDAFGNERQRVKLPIVSNN